ncbi:MAG: DUF4276 family protein [Niveispirillum sp.]|uniref:DUF4276 family protein n=1 Tax=Niveispirillum sp. TaxID=1917217 RepID=UPI0040371D28
MTHAEPNLIFLVEEPSMEQFLVSWLGRQRPGGLPFQIITFQGKSDLLSNLTKRLRAYAAWAPPEWRFVVIVDRDDDDCRVLKQQLETICATAGFPTRRNAGADWRCLTAIAIEELEAWYFGNWDAVQAAFPGLSSTIPAKAAFRDPDAIAGGTWEAFERVMRRAGHYGGGLAKLDASRRVGACLNPLNNRSASFAYLLRGLFEAGVEL